MIASAQRWQQTKCSIGVKDLDYGLDCDFGGVNCRAELTSLQWSEHIIIKRDQSMRKLVVLLILGLAIAAYFYFDGQQYLSVGIFQGLYQQQPWLTALIYFAVYLLVAGLSLPGAAVLTIIGGMIFGFWTGLVLVSFASSIGATLAFFVSRFILRDWVQNKFAQYLGSINQGMEKQGAFYLFSLRLIPLFPFWAINLVMGLTIIPGTTFYWVSQLGMLAGTAVFVNAGVF
jgi:uncharacterized membrane protein YdjX (TVP38/TMEM64 family)